MKRMFIGLLFLAAMFVMFYEPPTKQVDVVMSVKRGDTLWTMVGEAMERVGDKRYIQEVIYETKKVNDLSNDKIGNLPIGAIIVIPCKVEM